MDGNINYCILLLGATYDKNLIISKCIPPNLKTSFSKSLEKNVKKIQIIGEEPWNTKIDYDEDIDTLKVYSYYIPSDIVIDSYNIDDNEYTVNKIELQGYNKIIFVSSWQYETDSMDKLVHSITDNYNKQPDNMMVLFESDVPIAATDIGNHNDVIKNICKKYNKFLYTIIFKSEDSILEIIRPKIKISNKITQDYCRKYRDWKEELQDEKMGMKLDFNTLDVVPVIQEEYINPQALEKYVYGFNKLKKLDIRKDITAAFIELFNQNYYEKAENLILEFYKSAISRVCVWDESSDIKILKEKLKKQFERCTMKDNKKYSIPKSKTKYNSLETKSKVKAKFSEDLLKYYTKDVWEILYNHMKFRSEQIEEQLEDLIKEI